jgi:hypothetical protein
VQRKVEILLGSADGPVIGTAIPGAFLPVIAYGFPKTEVALPGYKVRSVANWDPVRVFVDTASLGTDRSVVPPAQSTHADYLDHELFMLAAEDATAPFASTACGPLRVVQRNGERVQVAQYADGIEVQGWLSKRPEERHGENHCPPRVVRAHDRERNVGANGAQPLPPGYVSLSPRGASRDPLKRAIENGASLFWLVRGDREEPKCIKWRAKLVSKEGSQPDAGVFRYKAEIRRVVDKDRRLVSSFDLDYAADGDSNRISVSLRGPTSFIGNKTTATALCGEGYEVVESTNDRVTLVRGSYPRGIVAYHPDDTELWYLNRERCAAAAEASDASTIAAHVHQGC